MDQHSLEKLLAGLPFGAVRYFPSLTSTNDLATRWVQAGAADLSLVVADEQTAGRGRLDRRWFTPPGVALAFSVILTPTPAPDAPNSVLRTPMRYTALGALAVCDALNQALPPMLPAQIKWPNDVIAQRRKLAGILAEAQWNGDQLSALVLGIGINVAPGSAPPPEAVSFPATCVESVVEGEVDRWGLLRAALEKLLFWRQRLESPEFIQAWGMHLAFRGEWVHLAFQDRPPLEGQVMGLSPDGSLRVRTRQGEVLSLQTGEIHLRPMNSPAG
jgi:BirA family biotin operon repressor/biotin-[acetyl-CoA-carboxylase] ligase